MRFSPEFRFPFTQAPLGPGPGNGASFRRGIPREARPLAAIAAAFVAALLIGKYSTQLTTKEPLVIVAAGALFWLVAKRPRWGVVLFLAMTSTLIIPDFFERWTSENMAYGMYLFILLLLIVRAFTFEGGKAFERLAASPVAITMAVFIALIVAKSVEVMVASGLNRHTISSVLLIDRSLLLYLVFIPVLLMFGSVRSQRRLAGAILALGGTTVFVALLSLVLHNSLLHQFMAAQSLQSDTPGVSALVERLRPPGDAFMLFGFWIGIMNLAIRPWTKKRVALFVPLTLLMLTGVLLEFNRSYIVPMLGLLLVAALINRKNVRMKLLAVAAGAAILLVLFAAATGTLDKYVSAIALRYGTTFSSNSLDAQSLLSRQVEDGYAWKAIESSPVFGIGLDQLYRPPVPKMLDNLRWYIHDSFIWFWTYFGLTGLAAFAAMLAAGLLRGVTNWKKIRDPLLQATVLGLVFALITLVAADFYAPKFYEFQTVPVVALAVGLIEAIIYAQKRDGGRDLG